MRAQSQTGPLSTCDYRPLSTICPTIKYYNTLYSSGLLTTPQIIAVSVVSFISFAGLLGALCIGFGLYKHPDVHNPDRSKKATWIIVAAWIALAVSLLIGLPAILVLSVVGLFVIACILSDNQCSIGSSNSKNKNNY